MTELTKEFILKDNTKEVLDIMLKTLSEKIDSLEPFEEYDVGFKDGLIDVYNAIIETGEYKKGDRKWV